MKKLLVITGFLALALPAIFAVAAPAQAATFSLFPDETTASDYRQYIANFYSFAIPASVLVATVLIMIGGVIWVTSAGDQGRISKAREFIINPIIGVVLLFGAYILLAFINPAYVNLESAALPELGNYVACVLPGNTCEVTTDTDCKQKNGQPLPNRLCDTLTAQEQIYSGECSTVSSQFIQRREPTYLCSQFCQNSNCAVDRLTVPPSGPGGDPVTFEYGIGTCTCKTDYDLINPFNKPVESIRHYLPDDQYTYDLAIQDCREFCPTSGLSGLANERIEHIERATFSPWICQCKDLVTSDNSPGDVPESGNVGGSF